MSRRSTCAAKKIGACYGQLQHVRIAVCGRRHIRFLDRARRCPAQQVESGAGFVIGSATTRPAKRLLSDHGARRFVVHIEVTRREAERGPSFGNCRAVTCEDRARERVRARAVHQLEHVSPRVVPVDVHRKHRPKDFFAH